MEYTQYKKLANVTLGKQKADLVLKNLKLVDVFTGEIVESNVAVKDGLIAGVFPECDIQAKPGFMIQASIPRKDDNKKFFLEMRNAEHYSRTRLRKWDDGGRWQYILEKSQDALRYLERNGLSATIHKIENKLGGNRKPPMTHGVKNMM